MLFSVALIVFAAVALTALAQKGKEGNGKGNNKEQQKDHGQPAGKGNKDRGNQDRGNKDNPGKGNDNADNPGRKDDHPGKGNKGEGYGKDDNPGKDKGNEDNRGRDEKASRAITEKGYKWDDDTFRDRDKIRRNQEKVTICHKPGRENEPGVTITVSSAALKAHLNHGDVQGDCPKVDNPRFSDAFLRRRTDYFTTLQESQEQVIYSRSILDYALERLTGARAQLVTMQRSNVPASEIDSRRLLIVDLEKDVSLLEQVLGVTANLVANRLMQ